MSEKQATILSIAGALLIGVMFANSLIISEVRNEIRDLKYTVCIENYISQGINLIDSQNNCRIYLTK